MGAEVGGVAAAGSGADSEGGTRYIEAANFAAAGTAAAAAVVVVAVQGSQ